MFDVHEGIFSDQLLEENMLKHTKLYQELEKRQSSYREKIDKIYEYASKVLPKINHVFANYTGHGLEHSVNVMNYMYDGSRNTRCQGRRKNII